MALPPAPRGSFFGGVTIQALRWARARASDTYGTFALGIGLISLLFLQAQLTLVAAEVNVVLHRHLWPRSLTGDELTDADRHALQLQTEATVRRQGQRNELHLTRARSPSVRAALSSTHQVCEIDRRGTYAINQLSPPAKEKAPIGPQDEDRDGSEDRPHQRDDFPPGVPSRQGDHSPDSPGEDAEGTASGWSGSYGSLDDTRAPFAPSAPSADGTVTGTSTASAMGSGALIPRDAIGYDVLATDGSIGKIDETTDAVGLGHMVVDTGWWIFGKKRLLPVSTIRSIDHERQSVTIGVDKATVRNAPDLDEARRRDEAYLDEVGRYYDSLSS